MYVFVYVYIYARIYVYYMYVRRYVYMLMYVSITRKKYTRLFWRLFPLIWFWQFYGGFGPSTPATSCQDAELFPDMMYTFVYICTHI